MEGKCQSPEISEMSEMSEIEVGLARDIYSRLGIVLGTPQLTSPAHGPSSRSSRPKLALRSIRTSHKTRHLRLHFSLLHLCPSSSSSSTATVSFDPFDQQAHSSRDVSRSSNLSLVTAEQHPRPSYPVGWRSPRRNNHRGAIDSDPCC